VGKLAKNYFIIFDKGDMWQVTGTVAIPEGYEVSENHDGVMDMSDFNIREVFLYVKEKLETNDVYIPKNYQGRLIKDDVIIVPHDKIEVKRARTIDKGKDILMKKVSLFEIFNSVEFIILNNFFVEKGYVITDNNRQDKYLEIIETGDIELIEKLERFLKCRDDIMRNYTFHSIFREFRMNLEKAETEEEIDKIWKEFIIIF
jgi:hypothetical protein